MFPDETIEYVINLRVYKGKPIKKIKKILKNEYKFTGFDITQIIWIAASEWYMKLKPEIIRENKIRRVLGDELIKTFGIVANESQTIYDFLQINHLTL